MKSFPKKYKPQDLHNRSRNYQKTILNDENSQNNIYNTSFLPTYKKISYSDLFLLYLKDFFNCKKNLHNERMGVKSHTFQLLFTPSNDEIKNISSCYQFFNKKGQNLSQVGINKIDNHISSTIKKNLNANHKIIDSYLSSPHKISLPDSELYLYILNKFHSLRENGKISNETTISYQSFTLQTSIPQSHITRKEELKPQYVLKYFVGSKCESLPVYVDDIDTCCGDVALLVHPKDKRYNKQIGKNVIIPMCNRQIPIIGDESINIGVNNGIRRVCPCADFESIELAKKYGLPTNIYVFDYKGNYTEYINQPAYIGQERKKYYSNIQKLIGDIGNVAEEKEILAKVPYLNDIDEPLAPFKTDQITINLKEEKETIINKIFDRSLHFSFLDKMFEETFNEIINSETELSNLQIDKVDIDNIEKNHEQSSNIEESTDINEESPYSNQNRIQDLQNYISSLKQKIIDEVEKYLPDSLICDSNLPYGRRLPLLEQSNGDYSFFDIENDCQGWKEKPLQFCFDFVLLALIREGTIGIKNFGQEKTHELKLCEYDKIFSIFSKNEKKIQNFVQYLSKIHGDNPEYQKFIQIIQDLTDETNSSIGDCTKLIENSKFLQINDNRILLNITGISNKIFNPDLIQFFVPCYLNDKNIKFNDTVIHDESERSQIFQSILIQQLLIGKPIANHFIEYSYNKKNEFLGDEQLSKKQQELSLRNFISINGENPTRLNLLIDGTFNKNDIILHNIHLKQIRNAIRLCVQENYLPKDIKESLQNPPTESNDYDLLILYKLQEVYDLRKDIQTFEDFINFFHIFKTSIQNAFFSRYLEIQKVKSTPNVQFICAYFFNFILTVLYPLVPEFVEALCYISDKDFIQPINPINLTKSINYNTNILYTTFIKIKDIKLQFNIKQHEQCNIFIKSSPTICEILKEHEQILKNHFHIVDIDYLRLHEQNPLGYETITDDVMVIGIQSDKSSTQHQDSIENLEKEIKYLGDKLDLLRQRIQMLPEGEQRTKTEEEYAKTKEEIEILTIRHSLLSSK